MKRVLICPLDWGLGHATRMVPIIRNLLQNGHHIILAADGSPLAFLRSEFPTLEYLRLPSYNIRYSRNAALFALYIAFQIPKILFRIWQEHQWLKKQAELHNIDVVISDNRYGLFHTQLTTIFVCHQISIQLPKPFKIFQYKLFLLHRMFLRQHNQLWIPDYVNSLISGALTNSYSPNMPTLFLGNLSRFDTVKSPKKHIHLPQGAVVAVLSGVEPQRSVLEDILIKQMQKSTLPCVLVRGVPNSNKRVEKLSDNVQIIDFLGSSELHYLLAGAKVVICRAGYSSIMDLVALQKTACLIPTPGQTEQEYLAQYHHKRGWFFAQSQSNFDLEAAIEGVRTTAIPNNLQTSDLELEL